MESNIIYLDKERVKRTMQKAHPSGWITLEAGCPAPLPWTFVKKTGESWIASTDYQKEVREENRDPVVFKDMDCSIYGIKDMVKTYNVTKFDNDIATIADMLDDLYWEMRSDCYGEER